MQVLKGVFSRSTYLHSGPSRCQGGKQEQNEGEGTVQPSTVCLLIQDYDMDKLTRCLKADGLKFDIVPRLR